MYIFSSHLEVIVWQLRHKWIFGEDLLHRILCTPVFSFSDDGGMDLRNVKKGST